MRRFLRAAAILAVVLVVAFGSGFAAFVSAAHRAAAVPPEADGIVALTGGAERVETGLHLLASGRAKLLLVSGVAHGATLSDLLHRAGMEESAVAGRVTLGRVATTTRGNAQETAEWACAHQVGTLIVVTSGFHMPRALLELRRAIPQVVLYPMPVQPQSNGRLSSMRVLAGEYLKLLGAWAGLSHIVHQPLSMVWHTPVDKSVPG